MNSAGNPRAVVKLARPEETTRLSVVMPIRRSRPPSLFRTVRRSLLSQSTRRLSSKLRTRMRTIAIDGEEA